MKIYLVTRRHYALGWSTVISAEYKQTDKCWAFDYFKAFRTRKDAQKFIDDSEVAVGYKGDWEIVPFIDNRRTKPDARKRSTWK